MLLRLQSLFSQVGQYALFMRQSFLSLPEVKLYRKNLLPQMVRVGFNSLPVVVLAAAFTGVVTTLQTAYLLETTLLTERAIGTIVVPTLMLELCALIPGLVLASRVGASIAAEVGTMQVTEQIAALESMGLNAIGYLVLPRVLASLIMFPTVYVVACVSAIWAGGFAGEFLGYLSWEVYIDGARQYFLLFDAFYGMIKTMAFGFVITSIACWKGYVTRGGADGVGRSTTQAVVTSCMMILITDYILAELLL